MPVHMPDMPPLAAFSRHPMRKDWLFAVHPLDPVEDPYRRRVTLHNPRRDRRAWFHVWIDNRDLTRIAETAKRIDELEEQMKLERRAPAPDARQAALF